MLVVALGRMADLDLDLDLELDCDFVLCMDICFVPAADASTFLLCAMTVGCE